MKKTIAAALLGATLLGGGALAAVQDKPAPAARADANQDGVVTRQEALAAAEARFARADANKDGKLTAEERRAARPHHRGHGGKHGMRGGDRGEMRAKMLQRFDADKDGKLSEAERSTMRAQMKEMRGHDRGRPAPSAN